MSDESVAVSLVRQVANYAATSGDLPDDVAAVAYAERLLRHFALSRVLSIGDLPETLTPTAPLTAEQLVDAVLVLEESGNSIALLPSDQRARRSEVAAERIGISAEVLHQAWHWWSDGGRKVAP
jgi:hypothetical protein